MTRPLIYQMLPRLWGNGRFSAINDASLNYFKGMGFTHVWYTGVIMHSTGTEFVKGDPGSPYAIKNYYDVNPYLAYRKDNRMSEFKSLIKRTHKHGLKAIIDFVPNHVGRDYADEHGGIPHFEYSDYDWTDTFKINYSHPDTYGALLSILRFWAAKGVDGFRCDMVEMVPPEFFKSAIYEIKKDYPGIIFIAEVYQKEKYWQYIKEVGFDYLYDKSGLYDSLRALETGHGTARSITWNWQSLGDLQPNMLNFLENHDEQRIASEFFTGRTNNGASLATSLLFNKAPFMLYFGEEIGDRAEEGHEGRTSIFNFVKVDKLQRLWNSICNTEGKFEEITDVSKSDLTDEEIQILTSHKSLLELSRRPEFTDGLVYDLCYCQNSENGFNFDKHFAFIRKSSELTSMLDCVTFLLIANFDDFDAKIKVNIPEEAIDYLHIDRRSLPDEKTLTVCVPAHDVKVISF